MSNLPIISAIHAWDLKKRKNDKIILQLVVGIKPAEIRTILAFIYTSVAYHILSTPPSPHRINIAKILKPFQNCVINLTTFQPLENLSVGSNQLTFELENLTFPPVIVSSYKMVPGWEPDRVENIPHGNTSESRPAFHFLVPLGKILQCYVELYTVDFKVVSVTGVPYRTDLPLAHHDLVTPWVQSRYGQVTSYPSGLVEEQHYQLLLPKYNFLQIIIVTKLLGSLR